MSYLELFNSISWPEIERRIYATKPAEVLRVLTAETKRTLDDFLVLISPAAANYLEPMLELSQNLTKKRFGKVMQLYAPLYLSNECQNICSYCGFSLTNKIPRITLTSEQVLKEVEALKALGYEHILIVTGESNKTVGMTYFEEILRLIQPYFSQISFEVQPLEQSAYERLAELGLHAVLVYQETYNRDTYADVHPKGRKSNFEYRLETPDRLGRARIHKIGLGALFGLSDWRVDAWFVASHLNYLEKTYWRSRYSISFPRLRPAEGLMQPKVSLSERELLQIICAFRIFNTEVELSLSTRESQSFRDIAMQVGITSVSAGSKTEPGGYALNSKALKQFEISDERSPQEVIQVIRASGYEPVWKDWDAVLG